MPKFAANLSFLFQEVEFLDRFEAAARAGFRGVEYLFPYDYSPDEIATRLKAFDLKQVLFNLPPGDWKAGERGIAALPGREAEFEESVDRDLAEKIKANFGLIRHFQIAGNPGRHEPDVGEINYPYLFGLIDELGYQGWIGCEYRPKAETLFGLRWARRYGIGPRA